MFIFDIKGGGKHLVKNMEEVMIISLKASAKGLDFDVVSSETGEVLLTFINGNVEWVSSAIKYVI